MQKKSNYTYYLYYYICSNEIFHTLNMNVVDLRFRPFKVTRPRNKIFGDQSKCPVVIMPRPFEV